MYLEMDLTMSKSIKYYKTSYNGTWSCVLNSVAFAPLMMNIVPFIVGKRYCVVCIVCVCVCVCVYVCIVCVVHVCVCVHLLYLDTGHSLVQNIISLISTTITIWFS